ncbi:hypothetical protein CEXT_336271 [Caerostris extrusa]|uniref:Uncharacterized protein n=1 Tax=Caerostris extrusa TaxID=172846 RepID=A0AAV4UYM3_CAEEX|nr:hypothetical protein CEXT_336271 [Caerostris extrusa]
MQHITPHASTNRRHPPVMPSSPPPLSISSAQLVLLIQMGSAASDFWSSKIPPPFRDPTPGPTWWFLIYHTDRPTLTPKKNSIKSILEISLPSLLKNFSKRGERRLSQVRIFSRLPSP